MELSSQELILLKNSATDTLEEAEEDSEDMIWQRTNIQLIQHFLRYWLRTFKWWHHLPHLLLRTCEKDCKHSEEKKIKKLSQFIFHSGHSQINYISIATLWMRSQQSEKLLNSHSLSDQKIRSQLSNHLNHWVLVLNKFIKREKPEVDSRFFLKLSDSKSIDKYRLITIPHFRLKLNSELSEYTLLYLSRII